MANNIIKRVWNQNRMVNIEDLCGMAFQAEAGGHTFQIFGVDDTGAAVPLSGTVAGVFRRPDNADIALTGSASEGVASVTLTEDCYAVPGRFGLTIYTTADGQKTAIYAAVGTVAATNGGAVAGDTPQDVVDLINAIEAAVATIPADYTDLMAAIAPMYSNSALYAVGSYAWYDGDLYRCTTPITTAETWTAAHWTAAVIGDDLGDIIRAFSLTEFPGKSVIPANTINYTNNTAITNNGDGTYNVGTTDYGKTVFGQLTTLEAGAYLLFGVPGCRCFLSTDGGWPNRVAENTTGAPKIVTFENQVSVYLCFSNTSIPSSSYTIRPYLYDTKTVEAFRFIGDCPTNLDSLTEAGYYIKVKSSTHSPVPSGYDATNGVLLNLPKVLENIFGFQLLFDSSNTPRIWMRICRSDNTSTISTMPWVRMENENDSQATSKATKTNLSKLSLKDVSLSGNYFDWQNADWQNGFDTGSAIDTSVSGFHHAFAPLQGAGDYIRVMSGSTFGINATKVCLYDKDKNRIKVKTATRIGTSNGYSFSLTEDEALTAMYVTMNYYEGDGYYYSGLYYNSSAYPMLAGLDCPLPNFKALSSRLYKKTVIADGDSIAQASLDNPAARKGWWGRIVTDYSCTGKNYAVGGGTITDFTDQTVGGQPRHCVSLNIDTIHSEYAALDYLILDGGTNDADLVGQFSGDTTPARFGTWTETDFSGSYDTTKFCGAVEYMFYKAVNYWPKSKIGFIIPMEMGTNNSTVANRRRYYDEIVKIAKKWHIPVLDLWNESQMDARLSVYYDSTLTVEQNVAAKKCYNDGQHPTSHGYNLMQAKIDSWVNSL